MSENTNENVALLKNKAQKLFAELKDLEIKLKELEEDPLSISDDDLAIVKAIRDELGISLGDAIRVGTWPIDGPGSAACMHCLAGGGA